MSKSPAQRVEYLEGIVIGAGFLLKKLLANYEADLGIGMTEQIRQCIRDCDQVGRVHMQRRTTGAA
ncbi:hypothetical protein C9I56_38995 [Paraburkholderia caribensis]|uniref:hypothetical protein n=1 Tax=Paraburkholderia caribensis TaxID=75105 RepID=UPI000D15AD33|nr:hypothetical protein [Paraburkholderia caribensis]PTB23478.1 hypothetical protein C9I56_38995 [Paraburkholderia caribensis]